MKKIAEANGWKGHVAATRKTTPGRCTDTYANANSNADTNTDPNANPALTRPQIHYYPPSNTHTHTHHHQQQAREVKKIAEANG